MSDNKLIDFEGFLERRRTAEIGAMVGDAVAEAVADLAQVDAYLRSGQKLHARELGIIVGRLGDLMRMGFLGHHVRTWAASLLAILAQNREHAISAEDRPVVEEARAAIIAFDGVVFGSVTPEDARAFVLQKQIEEDRRSR